MMENRKDVKFKYHKTPLENQGYCISSIKVPLEVFAIEEDALP